MATKAIKKVVDLRDSKTIKAEEAKTVKFKDAKEIIAEKNEKTAKAKIEKTAEAKVEKTDKTQEVKVEAKKPEVKYKLSIGIQDMFAAGCHLGHKLAKTNPKVGDYLYMSKDGIQVIDLPKTVLDMERACGAINAMIKEGKIILFVGTKRSAREVVRRVATETGMPYVTSRWLGGIISNWEQIRKSIRTMNELEKKLEKPDGISKKELSVMRKNFTRMQSNMGGMSKLERIFDAVFLIDIGVEKTALKEAKSLGLPVFSLLDTDSNPGLVDYPIVANDDSVKSVSLVIEEIGKAILNK